MRAEAFGDANGPLAADRRSGGRILGEDVARCGAGGIEPVLEGEAKPEGAGLFAGFGESEAGEVGNFDLAAVDSETHGDEGGDERDDEHCEGAENDVEEAIDSGDSHACVSIYDGSALAFLYLRRQL